MPKLEYTFKNDVLFKMLFVKHPDLLKRLVSELLGITLGSISEFKITNPEMPPESLGDKFCRLDINMTVDGRHLRPTPTRNQRSVSRRRGRAPKCASVRVYADASLSEGCADEGE